MTILLQNCAAAGCTPSVLAAHEIKLVTGRSRRGPGHQQRPSEVDDELSVRDGQEAEQGKAAKTDGEHILGSLSCTTQLALFGCGVPLKWLGLGSRGKTSCFY